MAPQGHCAVADLGVGTATAIGDLADLTGQRRGVLGIAGKYLHRQRLALGVAQQPDDDLSLALFAVLVIAEGGQFIADSFEIYSMRPLTAHYGERRLRKHADFPAIIPNQISH